MSFGPKTASKKALKLRIALSAPSGAGKTYGALLLASGIAPWEKIAVIDTENESSNYYADLGPYEVIPFYPPYAPERFIEAIACAEASGAEVIILDSISHEWGGKGGVLEIKDAMMGNSYTNWGKLTPRHDAFVDAMRTSKCHVIATLRSKQDYQQVEKGGKIVIEKLGLAPVQRDGIEYEFGIAFNIDMKHNATTSKDRTGLFDGRPEFLLSAETGKELLAWANTEGAEARLLREQEIEAVPIRENIRKLLTQHKVVLGDFYQALGAEVKAAGSDPGKLKGIEAQIVNKVHELADGKGATA